MLNDSWENTRARAILKPNRAEALHNFHPWLFSGAVERTEGPLEAGDLIALYNAKGEFQAKGFYNPHSQIRMRVVTFQEEPVGLEFFRKRLQNALDLRQRLIPPFTNAYRLLASESDLWPGWVLDRYAETLVFQCYSLGMARRKEALVALLQELLHPQAILERSEALHALKEERLEVSKRVWLGEVPERIEILENGIRFAVNLVHGQKTGFFLDQRENRARVGEWAAGKRLLNCFAYTGGFSLYAALRGAQTTSVELNPHALELARENFRLNGLDPEAHRFLEADVFELLRELNEPYEMIILDPPAFVKRKLQLEAGARGYKDINRLALQKLPPQGWLLTCSCSGHVTWDLFQKILFAAAQESGRQVQIIGRFAQGGDHPVHLFHPESEYLKAFLLRVTD